MNDEELIQKDSVGPAESAGQEMPADKPLAKAFTGDPGIAVVESFQTQLDDFKADHNAQMETHRDRLTNLEQKLESLLENLRKKGHQV
jgi:hypothetical protein